MALSCLGLGGSGRHKTLLRHCQSMLQASTGLYPFYGMFGAWRDMLSERTNREREGDKEARGGPRRSHGHHGFAVVERNRGHEEDPHDMTRVVCEDHEYMPELLATSITTRTRLPRGTHGEVAANAMEGLRATQCDIPYKTPPYTFSLAGADHITRKL